MPWSDGAARGWVSQPGRREAIRRLDGAGIARAPPNPPTRPSSMKRLVISQYNKEGVREVNFVHYFVAGRLPATLCPQHPSEERPKRARAFLTLPPRRDIRHYMYI